MGEENTGAVSSANNAESKSFGKLFDQLNVQYVEELLLLDNLFGVAARALVRFELLAGQEPAVYEQPHKVRRLPQRAERLFMRGVRQINVVDA